jgi:abhydrolase domain-containing protein 6
MLLDLLHKLIRCRYSCLGFHSCYLDTGSCMLHYIRRQNAGATGRFIFLHGLGTTSDSWIKTLPYLKLKADFVCPDLPGHGSSRILTGDRFFSIGQMGQVLENFMSLTNLLPVTLVGHSLGGWLAARFASKYPDNISRLILINNAGIRYPGFEKQAEAFRLNNTRDARRLLHRIWYRYPPLLELFTFSLFRHMQKKHISDFVTTIDTAYLLNDCLPLIKMPVDIIWGEDDRLISRESVEVMKNLLPQARTHFIPRCGHVPQLERPTELISILNDILTAE